MGIRRETGFHYLIPPLCWCEPWAEPSQSVRQKDSSLHLIIFSGIWSQQREDQEIQQTSLCVRKARLSLILFAWEGHLPGLPTYSLSLGPLENLHGWCSCHMNANFPCPSKEGRKRRPCHLQKQTAGSLIVNTQHKTVGGNKHSSMEGSKQTDNLNSSL